jgi:(S)-ureidoglycine aminohydrolase
MKLFSLVALILLSGTVMAQADTLPAAVYNWNKLKPGKNREVKQVLKGSTLDLAMLDVHTTDLKPGQSKGMSFLNKDFDELIIVKKGTVQVTIKDTTKTIGPRGMAFVAARDNGYTVRNSGGEVATYYVLTFRPKRVGPSERNNEQGRSFVRDWSEFQTLKTAKGESRPISNEQTSLFAKFEIHATSLDPGFASHDPHTHRAEEIILLMEGDVQMQIGQTDYPATAGDVIFLEANVLHALKNTGHVRCTYFAIQWLKREGTK